MKVIADKPKTKYLQTFAPILAIVCFCVAACCVGVVTAIFGAASSKDLLTIAVIICGFLGLGALLTFDLPFVLVARQLFIVSFFFKGEINLMKIDEIEDPSGFNVSLTLLFALILFISDFYETRRDNRPSVFPLSFSIALGALFLCATISAIYGANGLLGWFSLWSFGVTCFVCYVIASHFSRRERIIELLIGVGIGLTLTGFVSITQFLLDFPKFPFFGTGTEEEMLGTQSVELSRVSAFLRTPTEMGWVIATFVPFALTPVVCFVKQINKLQRIFLITATGFGIAAILLSLARGSWIALVLAIAIVVAFGWIKMNVAERKTYFASMGGLALILALLLAPFSLKVYERLTADDEGSALIRIPLMETAVRMIKANPLVGVGLNAYRTTMTKYDETSVFVTQIFPNPVHNVFAHITAEIGVLGGALFALLFIIAIYECWQSMQSRDKLLFALGLAGLAAIVAFVVSGIKEPGSLGSVRPPLRTCFFMFGAILAVSRVRRQYEILQ